MNAKNKVTEDTLCNPPGRSSQCFEGLYKQYVDKVYQQCLSMTSDSEQAQDFTHDIFLRVFHKLDGFEQRSSFSTWLYSIAYNYCADQLRLAKRFPTYPLEDVEEISTETDNQHLQEEALQAVERAMRQLTQAEQKLLRLKHEEGKSVEEIAELYGLKPNTVKMRLQRSRQKVRQLCHQPGSRL